MNILALVILTCASPRYNMQFGLNDKGKFSYSVSENNGSTLKTGLAKGAFTPTKVVVRAKGFAAKVSLTKLTGEMKVKVSKKLQFEIKDMVCQ